MSLRTAGGGISLVVFLWSVAVVLSQNVWSVTYTTQRICTLKGSTVEMSCSIRYQRWHKVTRTFWFTKMYDVENYVNLRKDPDYKGRVTYRSDKTNGHTLRITDLRESDSATYKFRFITDQTRGRYTGDPGVTLSVTGLQVKVTGGHQDKTLTCSTTCTLTDNPTYIWYKNGQHLDESTSPQYKDSVSSNYEDSYSCAVKGHENLLSPAVYGPRNTSVSVSPSGEIVEGSSVTLTCSSDANPPVQSYTWWYKKNGGDYQSMTGPQHVFSQIQSSDTGEYYCESQNEMGTDWSRTINMDVKYGPKNTSVSVSPSGEIVEGSSVTLTCSSDANPPVDKYTWYKKNVTSPKASGQSYTIHNVSSEDREGYYCEALNIIGRETIPVHINVTSVFSWVPVMGVGAVLTAGALLLTIYCYMKRRSTGESDATADTQSFHPDPNSETYTALNMKTRSPEYDTLANVRDFAVTQPLK
ncbi:B-cell receptor CD22-like isoform X2 [Oncorhynchus nerka]|uniref:B-cell receptor CD22-like isoform X2 n=1 Tax=Oncorhynchus nerka TaxID=8023 RepID=UPI0031B896E8